MDDLVDRVFERFKDRFFPNESEFFIARRATKRYTLLTELDPAGGGGGGVNRNLCAAGRRRGQVLWEH